MGPNQRIAAAHARYLAFDDARFSACSATPMPFTASAHGGPLIDPSSSILVAPKHVRVLSMNIWNINGHDQGLYPWRVEQLTKIMVDADADIIALQEVL